ncbi:MAG: hypothetical protein ACK4RK_00795 [Gemmataceae bacterium]
METVYLICAILGGTILVGQFLLSVLGVGGDHDGGDASVGDTHDIHTSDGHDHHGAGHGGWFVGVLTFRTVVAALTFFGLIGMMGSTSAWSSPVTFVLAVAAGAGAMFLVAWVMKSLHQLRSDGTVRIERTVGEPGTVYLRIPGHREGVGKVTVSVQNRSVEFQAVTNHDALPTGAKIIVVGVVNSDTLEVAPLVEAETERTIHA